jgi:hypothetical protein
MKGDINEWNDIKELSESILKALAFNCSIIRSDLITYLGERERELH